MTSVIERHGNKMIKSMTGFGRYEYVGTQRKITVEMKAVNHRYLEVNVKLPRKFNIFESEIRNEVKKYCERGKIDIFVSYEEMHGESENVKCDENLAKQYIDIFKELESKFGITNDMRASTLLRCPDVIVTEEAQLDEKELLEELKCAVQGAAQGLLETRKKEGENLRKDLLDKLEVMLQNVKFIEERSPQIIEAYRKKIENKVNELLEDAQIDESRIAAETVIFADKICVDEETVRLKSHVEAMKNALDESISVGRKLDFIAQEMNRESNTILSKSNDLEITNCAIELKTDVEKIREQIQNIE